MDLFVIPLSLLFFLIVIGLCAGIVTGVMGGSGVSVVVPMLVLFAGFPVHLAIGTSLFVDVAASLVTSLTYYQHRNLDLSRGLWMALAAVIGAQLGGAFAASAPEGGLSWIFGVFLVLNGAYVLKTGMKQLSKRMPSEPSEKPPRHPDPAPRMRGATAISILLGLGIGTISGFIGASGGLMFLLVLLLVFGYEVHSAIGTSTLIMAITATSGASSYFIHGNLDIAVALVISAGALISSRIGAMASNKLGEITLKRIVALILIALGVIMLINTVA
jgi:uncharacterized membrane protein YfcA